MPDYEARVKELLDEAFRRDPEHRTQFVIDFFETFRGSSSGDPTPVLSDHDIDDLAPGDTIGPFRIESRIATGGMGAVYRAQQLTPFERLVAVKALRVDLRSAEAIARFEIERQALALMNHPNIAQIFDGGVTASGRSYFAMEFVEGAPLLEHCDRERLSLSARLGLFAEICDGVQHAHQKGIVHRDLKPMNILITPAGVPKVIDFGIAK